ncbi:MAG: S41 family peptidase [Candidatus Eremiobacteraeota bacterium]|nr:S41 family peptidase [Candidatus Eremiobacteraeota bacterium]MBC5823953.1 S41 family peptidase [Candidatus Eremiobacteraeota bacterium]
MIRALALVVALSASATARSHASDAATDLSALDLLELQIGYTTLLATYDGPVTPREIAGGARQGVAAYLVSRGIDDALLPYVPQRLNRDDGGELIDRTVLGALLHYGKRLRADAVVQAALAGEAASLHDPYTLLFHPSAFKRFNAFLGNETFGGIGAVVAIEPDGERARVESIIPGSPAERAGVQAADEIVAIDGARLGGKSPDAVRAMLRGKIGTTVRLSLVREGEPLPGPVAIVRAAVSQPIVLARMLPGNVGYVQLTRFGDDAAAQLAAALAGFRSRGVTALVLDLRGNGGGYGDEAKKVASQFIAAGPIFTIRERGGTAHVERATGQVGFSGKVAVLVDGDTASAAEIVAAALQDDGRATIVGTRTFGKGVVQSVFPLPDGAALKVTTARYVTPRGRNIDRVGITPDIVVAEPADAKHGDVAADPQLARALAAVAPASPGL